MLRLKFARNHRKEIRFLETYGLITAQNIDRLVIHAGESKKTGIEAFLKEYRTKRLGLTDEINPGILRTKEIPGFKAECYAEEFGKCEMTGSGKPELSATVVSVTPQSERHGMRYSVVLICIEENQ